MMQPYNQTNRATTVVLVAVAWWISLVVAFFVGRISHVGTNAGTADRGAVPHGFVQPNESSAPTTTANEPLVTTPEELVEAFRDNSVRAADRLRHKQVQITAPVSYVSNSVLGGDQAAVVFKVRNNSTDSQTVDIWFEPRFKAELGNLREGQFVTVTGTFLEEELSGDLKFDGTSIRVSN